MIEIQSNLTIGEAAIWRYVEECPACLGVEYERVGGDAAPIAMRIKGVEVLHPMYHIRKCRSCGLYFKSVVIDRAWLPTYYSAESFSQYEEDGFFPTEHVIHSILADLPDGACVLDFGCSTGRILERHARRLRCYGVEVNDSAAMEARRRGLIVVNDDSQIATMGSRFDLVLLSDVYEHLPKPVELTSRLVGYLKPAGHLVIVTGNADSIRTKEMLAEHWYFRVPGHLHMAGETHIDWLSKSLGVETQSVTRCSHYRLKFMVKLKQFFQDFSYRHARARPQRILNRILVFLPPLSKAKRWRNQPAVTYRKDHFVVDFRTPV